MNEHIKPVFLAFIAGLEQSTLVDLLTDLVNDGAIKERVLGATLKRCGVVFPDPNHEKITDHNIKRVNICYQSNYNGCSLFVLETQDGRSPEDDDLYEAFNEIDEKIGGLIVEHASEDCNDDGRFSGDIKDLEHEATYITKLILGDGVEVTFEEDNMST